MAKSSQARASRSAHLTGNGAVGKALNSKTDQAAMIWAPPVPGHLSQPPAATAVHAFERAMAALQRHDYRAARDAFQKLLEEFPTERALLDRARVYARLCDRELHRPTTARPQTLEERLTAATAAINNDQGDLAEQLLVQVIDEAPHHELGHYLMAVLHARRGDFSDAVLALRRASNISPEVLAQARHDDDFSNLRGFDGFEQLLAECPVVPPGGRATASGR